MSTAYFFSLQRNVERICERLHSKGIAAAQLQFGGPGPEPKKKVTVPTDARSEFLANCAMGDWAENKVADAVARACPDWKVVPYGNTDKTAAGEPGFKETYRLGLEETRQFGKRPDLLIFDAGQNVPDNLSMMTHVESGDFTRQARGAVEVRSSKFDALTYMAVRQRQRQGGDKSGKESPSFTVKVEDLKIVYRWTECYGLPQVYSQVFFDCIYAINFRDIFSYIADMPKLEIKKHAKNQEKATIMVPITVGIQIGRCLEKAKIVAEEKITKLGRHDFYARPKEGCFQIDPAKLHAVLLGDGLPAR